MKNNMMLIVVSGVAVAIAVAFAVLSVGSWIDISKSRATIQKQVKATQDILNSVPHPVESNLELIQADIKNLERKFVEARKIYGHPTYKVLEAFVAAFDRPVSTDSLMTAWTQKMTEFPPREDEKTEAAAKAYLNAFLREFATTLYEGTQTDITKSIERAKTAAAEIVREISVGDPRAQVDNCLLTALDYPVVINGVNCRFTISTTVGEMQKYLKADSEATVTLPSEEFFFGFDQYKTVPPPNDPETISAILTQLRMMEYIAKSARKAKLTSIRKIARFGDIKQAADETTGLVKYTYDIVVTGELSNIRDFVNAYSAGVNVNNFFYTVNIGMKKLAAEERPLIDQEKRREIAAKRPSSPTAQADDDEVHIEKFIGLNNTIEATIRVAYLVSRNVQK